MESNAGESSWLWARQKLYKPQKTLTPRKKMYELEFTKIKSFWSSRDMN